MHVQSALAIRRQRKRRDEQRKAKERRYSLQSSESGLTSPRGSQTSLEHAGHNGSRRQRHRRGPLNPAHLEANVSHIGMLHVGVVFLVLGLFLVGSGLLPDDLTSWSALGSTGWWNELVCTGLFATAIGLFLIVLNKYISKKEDDDLEKYVQSQLTRSRSGHRLERDVETGGMLTKHTRREKRLQREGEERGFGREGGDSPPLTPQLLTEDHHGFVNPVNADFANGDLPHEHHLDQIVEESEYFNKDSFSASVHTRDGRHMVVSRM